MPKTMLIDATHIEETRVAVVDGHRLVEYDYESKVRKQLKGSIFLAKVTRVEPSLQAAFVNFGGNRHGFLPFSEIHPDYFRIPVADREALLAAQIAELEEHDEEMEQQEARIEQAAEGKSDDASEEEDDEEEEELIVEVGGEDQPLIGDDLEDGEEELKTSIASVESDDEEESFRAPIAMETKTEILHGPTVDEDEEQEFETESGSYDLDESDEDSADEQDSDNDNNQSTFTSDENGIVTEQPAEQQDGGQQRDRGRNGGRGRHGRGRNGGGRNGRNGGGRGRNASDRGGNDDRGVDTLGGDGVDSDRPFRFTLRRQYKIQEVIKRGQIMLIQISKEERGNKGAAVTTYLSMPGRYCVLMPNSPRGGGVSRKIASFKDRKRMKDMLTDLAAPEGMSVILRTAGVTRTKVEIKRDLDYLTRLWNTIREHTLQSSAPALIYEEGSLIKRAIRDLYSRDIEDVHVAGEEGYKQAKEFMKMLMPSHAKKVQEYKSDRFPMFHKYGVENQISEIGEPVVNLKSGGYLVINPTEALVSIDVNSGRATKERHIEETAVKTNLEAADEVARQLRLRDLGGLVVIDFIDMEDRRNNRKVEQRLRDALSSDRARIQVGRISSFGLLELSRQRLNPSLAESQQEVCQHCMGTGRVKTLDFSAISIIRALEAEGIKGKATDITLTMSTAVALYVMNNKRRLLNDIETRYGFAVQIETDDTMSSSQYKLTAETRAAARALEGIRSVSVIDTNDDGSEIMLDDDLDDASDESGASQPQGRSDRPDRAERGEDDRGPRRRRGRRGGRGRNGGRDGARDDAQSGPREDGDLNGNVAAPVSDDFDGEQESPEDTIGNRVDQPRDNNGDGEARGDRPPRRDNNRRGGRGGRDRNRNRGDRPDRADRPAGQDLATAEQPRERQVREEQPRAPREHAAEASVQPAQAQPAPSKRSAPASNDAHGEAPAPREYEKVNQAPEQKKKGWWNRLVE